MKINFIPDEFWWGGITDIGMHMPWCRQDDYTIDPAQTGNDQRSPLFLSNKGRCIWSKRPFSIHFKHGLIETSSEIQLETGGMDLKGAHAIAAKKMFKCSEFPDKRFFQVPQYNTWIELMYQQNQTDIMEYAHSILQNGMQPGILIIDEGWDEYYGAYSFHPGRFPDPKKMIGELHALGFSVMLWISPYISPDSNAFRVLRNTDILLRDKNGNPAIREWWNGFSAVLDISNPKAASWYRNKLSTLQETYGIDGFKFDGGDPSMYKSNDITAAVCAPLGCTADYAKFAAGFRFNEIRAAWNMGSQPLVCRLHDKQHNWSVETGIKAIIPNMLVQGLLGYYYGCPDMIGGGDFTSFTEETVFDEELYIRWLEVSLLCPMIQFSVAPWRVLTPSHYQMVKNLICFRSRYVPYIQKLVKNASELHEPIIRALDYEFPNQGYEEEQTMYMLGSRFLVAPVLEKGKSSRSVRLPSGMWQNTDGQIYEGNSVYNIDCPLGTLKVFEKTA